MIDPASGDLLRSLNGGTTFDLSLPASELQDPQLLTIPRVVAVDDELGFAISSSYGLLRTADGGQTWGPVALPQVNGVSPVIHDIAFAADGSHGLLSVDDGEQNAISILSTTDGGASWSFDRLPSDMLDNGALCVPGCFAFLNDTEAFAGSTTVFSYSVFYIGDPGNENDDDSSDAGTGSGPGARFNYAPHNESGNPDESSLDFVDTSDSDDPNCGCVISRVALADPNTPIIWLLPLAWMIQRRRSR
jgi:hypothetical protein